MTPPPGERLQKHVGDVVPFTLQFDHASLPEGWKAFLRTNLGRGRLVRDEIVQAHFRKLPLAGAAWRDIPMEPKRDHWELTLALVETGYFKAKAYALDPLGRQHWVEGSDFGISIHPSRARTANVLYCAFTRLFGDTRFFPLSEPGEFDQQIKPLDKAGYAVIPPSGKLRDLTRQLPHIIDRLGCRILHLLPINPTPTVFARFGRYGSPYAVQDLAAIDSALVEFDKKTTGIDQFKELAYAVHCSGARLFLDVVINHTGWGSTLQEKHPQWYLRDADGFFISPGAWGTIWEDLAELDHRHPSLWEHLAEVFLTWCRWGVDGFRCDAGYKIPTRAWQYIVARVQEEFPETIFFLEGLGGAWEATEQLLTEGGMQWAYSELFQNYTPDHISGYLDHSIAQSRRVGPLIHYSETHDNDRLAKKGTPWALMRNQLSALASTSGGFGFTCGVEWLAQEKINVHGCTGLAWNHPENLVDALAVLNKLLSDHPAFFDGAEVRRISEGTSPVLALERISAEGLDRVLVLINTDAEKEVQWSMTSEAFRALQSPRWDWLTSRKMSPKAGEKEVVFDLHPGQSLCLSKSADLRGLSGEIYRERRACAAWAVEMFRLQFPGMDIQDFEWKEFAELVWNDPVRFVGTLSRLDWKEWPRGAATRFREVMGTAEYVPVSLWKTKDATRELLVPSGHWLLILDEGPFRAALSLQNNSGRILRQESFKTSSGFVACFGVQKISSQGVLQLERYGEGPSHVSGNVRFLPPLPLGNRADLFEVSHEEQVGSSPQLETFPPEKRMERRDALALFTNGIGGMARVRIDLGAVQSKYDCLLAANLHPSLPVDRHVFIKRLRAWLNADGFISPLNWDNLLSFQQGPPGYWRFLANAGDGRSVEVHLQIDMLEGYNTTVVHFSRPFHSPATGKDLPEEAQVRLVLRFDLEDRSFHCETKRNGGAEHHFTTHSKPLEEPEIGFAFVPASERRLVVTSNHGRFHPEPEWSMNLPHPVEQSRGQEGSGDAFSPGWFEIDLAKGSSVTLVATASGEISMDLAAQFGSRRQALSRQVISASGFTDPFGQRLALAASAFLVRREEMKTVIAGYPWFLDWGRDTFICARGYLAAGRIQEVKQLILLFGRYEDRGTLPNTIFGPDASNRDTSDAPLWYAVACEDLVRQQPGERLYTEPVRPGGRTVVQVLESIAEGYIAGTPNGIRMDAETALIWSPSHFTWMDTNYPAGTPREGYPVEIQVLWIHLLRQLSRIGAGNKTAQWRRLEEQAERSFLELFWLEEEGILSDCLFAPGGASAREAVKDHALRSNFLLAICFEILKGERARRAVDQVQQWLVIPGALRSLAPKRVDPPLPIHGPGGQLLNDPVFPYCPVYLGDEDTQRKPAYHNGTAWGWTFPSFCEALVKAWNYDPLAVDAAKSYLASYGPLFEQGCLGHLPEVRDGDYPHAFRGCDAQSWSVTEPLRVWKWVNGLEGGS